MIKIIFFVLQWKYHMRPSFQKHIGISVEKFDLHRETNNALACLKKMMCQTGIYVF